MYNYQKSRRKFIKNLGLTSLGISSMPSSILKLKTWAASAANNSSVATCNDYKALVCFYMFGGNDGFNMLAPIGPTSHAEYANSRGNLALSLSQLTPLNPVNYSGTPLGLHPDLPDVHQLFEDGKLSFLANVGTKLVQDTTASNIINQQNIPLSLFSHSDQRRQWHSARVKERSHIGWAGKIADLLGNDCNNNTDFPMNISLFNNSLFLNGEPSSSFALNRRGPYPANLYHHNHGLDSYLGLRTAALDSIHQYDYQNAFYNNYNSIFEKGIADNQEYRELLIDFENNIGLNTSFSNNTFSADLKMVAKSIAIGEDMGFNRQIYFVHVPNFDSHAQLISNHSSAMSMVNTGLVEFNTALEDLGKEDKVVTFSMSDFGRTLASNGNGSDHAWGSNAIVMGGPVVGQSIFGNYPSLALNADMIYSIKGIVIPEMASDLYFAELALWFGVPMSELGVVFPNLNQFFEYENANNDDRPLGFLPA